MNLVPRTGVFGMGWLVCRVSGRVGLAKAGCPGAVWRNYIIMNAKIALGLSDMTPEEKVTFTEERITSLTDNAATFPQPNPSVAALTTAKNNVDLRLKAIAQMETALEAERATAVTATTELDALLTQEAAYVENIAKGVVAIILLSGFPLAQESAPIGQLPPPQNLTGAPFGLEGIMQLKWGRVHGARSYVAEYATSPDGPWSQAAMTTRVSCLAGNLTPGVKYWFRVRALGAAGLSGWSEPVAKVAA